MNDPVLTQALAVLDTADVAASNDAGCTDLLGAIRKVRGWVDAVEARVTTRMRELHATGGAAPAADLHTQCGGVSSAVDTVRGHPRRRTRPAASAAPHTKARGVMRAPQLVRHDQLGESRVPARQHHPTADGRRT